MSMRPPVNESNDKQIMNHKNNYRKNITEHKIMFSVINADAWGWKWFGAVHFGSHTGPQWFGAADEWPLSEEVKAEVTDFTLPLTLQAVHTCFFPLIQCLCLFLLLI